MQNKYLVFIITGYEEITPEGNLTDSCELQLIAESYTEALERAKSIIDKPQFRLKMVIEKYAE